MARSFAQSARSHFLTAKFVVEGPTLAQECFLGRGLSPSFGADWWHLRRYLCYLQTTGSYPEFDPYLLSLIAGVRQATNSLDTSCLGRKPYWDQANAYC